MWLHTTNQSSQILYNGDILDYTNPIVGQYVFQLKEILELPAIVNLKNAQQKKKAKPGDIELWHLYIGYLGYKNLTTLKNLSSGMNLKETTPSKLVCEDCQKED